jgi:hypothetical protein
MYNVRDSPENDGDHSILTWGQTLVLSLNTSSPVVFVRARL